jgi:NADPH2:quinone reductase
MATVVQITRPGGPEVLTVAEVPVGEPGAGQVRLRHTAIGLNFIDIYYRTGLYQVPSYPSGLGQEGAGVITAVGPEVTGFAVGDRVAYGFSPLGAYATERLVPAACLVKLPDGIDDRSAAAMMLKGLTAQYLLRRTYRVKAGDTILFHAAAGGVGLIACQWAKALGATVIGTVGSAAKVALAKAHGCDHVIDNSQENFADRVREITGGQGVPVVYDSLGAATFNQSLDCLAPFGTMVSFGNSTGKVPPLDIGVLAAKGSLYVTRPTLATHAARRDLLEAGAKDLFDVVTSGQVRITINQEYPLAQAADAQRALESRQTTGSTVLLP